GPAGGDPVPRHDARRRGLSGPVRQAGRVPERTQGVRAGRPPVPSLPDAHQGRQDRGAERVLLPAVPVVVAGTAPGRYTRTAPTSLMRSSARWPSPLRRSTARIADVRTSTSRWRARASETDSTTQ